MASLQVKGPDGQTAPLVAKAAGLLQVGPDSRLPSSRRSYGPWMLLMGLAVGGSAVGLAYWGRRGGRLPRVLLGLEHVVLGLVLGIPGHGAD